MKQNKIIEIRESGNTLDTEGIYASVSISSNKKTEEIKSRYVDHIESEIEKQPISESQIRQ
jgi:hypothetical protein